MNLLSHPKWADCKMLREIVSPRITPKILKQLRDEGKVKYNPVGIVQKGDCQGQPTKVEYLTADVLMAWDEGAIEKGIEKGGNIMANGWKKTNKAGQSYLKLVKGV